MKVFEALKRYGLLTQGRKWDRDKLVYYDTEEYTTYDINCGDGGKKELMKYQYDDLIAYNLEEFGGCIIYKGTKTFYVHILFSGKFYTGGMNFKGSRIKDLSEVEGKIDMTKLTIDNNELFDEFKRQIEEEKLKKLAKAL
jgi:hypothetical protein